VGYIIPNDQYLGRQYDDYGCLEGLAGSIGIIQRTQQRLAAGHLSSLTPLWQADPLQLTAPLILSAARQGDQLAQLVVQETITYLSIAVANVACIIDPDRIVISGELAEFGDLFVEPIRACLHGLIPVMPEIELSDLGLDAPVLGAVATALRQTSDWLVVHRPGVVA
jgi:glucokinase